jgi:dTMP kinase
VRLLVEHLRDLGYTVVPTREPGGTVLGEELRRLAKHSEAGEAPCPVAELLIMGASRAQHCRQVVAPGLAAGGIVVCDRFADSTTVYQGKGRDLDMGFVQAMHRITTGGCWPAITFLLDVPTEVGLARSRGRSYGEGVTDRFEEECTDFHRRIRAGFLELAASEPDRFRVFSTSQPEARVHAAIVAEVESLIAARNPNG